MVCSEQKSREKKSDDVDDCAAQHGTKPHGERLQDTPMLDMVLPMKLTS
jgi:hypothetical protein